MFLFLTRTLQTVRLRVTSNQSRQELLTWDRKEGSTVHLFQVNLWRVMLLEPVKRRRCIAMNLHRAGRGVIARKSRRPERKGKEKALERGLSQLPTLRKRHRSQIPTRRTVYAHQPTQGCGIVTHTAAEGGTGPVATAAHCAGNTGKAMLEDVVEEDTEDSKEVEGEEEVTTEVVVVTTPPIRTDLEIEMTASIATL